MEYYSADKNEIRKFEGKHTELENFFSEWGNTDSDKYFVFSCMTMLAFKH